LAALNVILLSGNLAVPATYKVQYWYARTPAITRAQRSWRPALKKSLSQRYDKSTFQHRTEENSTLCIHEGRKVHTVLRTNQFMTSKKG
jgi:hypothetical protein